METCLRATVLLAVTLSLATIAGAATLPDEVAELEQALTKRVDAIGPSPATKAEGGEAKKLTKANVLLDGYTGANDIADFKALGRAGKLIHRSKTTDEGIRDEVGDILQCMAELARTQKGLAEDVLATLSTPKYQGKVQRILDKAESILGVGLTLIDTDPVKAQRQILKAWKQYLKAELKGGNWFSRDQRLASGGASIGLPPGLRLVNAVFSFVIQNDSSKRYYIRDVVIDGTFRDLGTGQVVLTADKASVAAKLPNLFRITDLGGGAFEAPSLIEKKFPDFPSPLHSLTEYVSEYLWLELQSVTGYRFNGTIRLIISDRQKTQGENLWWFTIELVEQPF